LFIYFSIVYGEFFVCVNFVDRVEERERLLAPEGLRKDPDIW
jgi:hypothetical protein